MKTLLIKVLMSISLLITTYQSSASDSLIFQCYTIQNKKVEILRNDDVLYYSYGTDKKKDIVLKENLYNNEIPGMFSRNVILANKSGPYIYNNVIFKNGEYAYTVTVLSDINVPSEKTFSGIYVTKNGSRIAKIKCVDSTIKDQFESLYK
ncbi:hypothetical protein [Shimwellia blattae]|uniref:Uncharacterized protein n=1 Tax=Shimwellia blattae (strain ATCC 29907 / DSM 4481 / JCM 1650 / NBRC 105725 / CDC 9005-74) TaxID=630626 RepID=I2B918_SHIBC|nr:hypothetical protein [Shimwellia blattae]AFJ47022.1 hypothetical protein EBL_c19300 [Shimwellia blattae DSM 4481 = NBRC 105725]GAB80855.1 hypothetical protein EB105725_10_00420 [Shimwellia blattae DSM 4481 = NBRC 105725]VDY64516.1 Uncharacterised protein [Shimwellia blattae]VEC22624.1 Uncharacterised protein [Shimwellia blattae]